MTPTKGAIPHTENIIECSMDDKGRIPFGTALEKLGDHQKWDVTLGYAQLSSRTYRFVNLRPRDGSVGAEVSMAGCQARLTIPSPYRTIADLKKRVILVTRQSAIEVWPVHEWGDYCDDYQKYIGSKPNRR